MWPRASRARRDDSTSPLNSRAAQGRGAGAVSPCLYTEKAFRGGVHPPKVLRRVEPDLSGLVTIQGEAHVIMELRVDAAGKVVQTCVLRGVRSDVDERVQQAVIGWLFEPARLREDAYVEDVRLTAGTAVPVFLTISVGVGRRAERGG
jgi:hypothetical protein